MAFYTFLQNNTYGSWSYDPNAGIGPVVIIQASDADAANEIADVIGIYFDGCSEGRDCKCCGDRWYMVGESDGSATPEVFGEPALEYKSLYRHDPHKVGHLGFIHYADGRIVPMREVKA